MLNRLNVFIVTILTISVLVTGCAKTAKKPLTPPKTIPSAVQNVDANKQISIKEQLLTQGSVKKFKDLGELRDFMENNETDSINYNGINSLILKRETSLGGFDGAAPNVAQKTLQGGVTETTNNYSETNIQVAGVDEADIVKTDGDFIYAIVKTNLFIIDATPAQDAKIISKIEFKSQPTGIYIQGDKLTVYGNDNHIYESLTYSNFRRRGQYVFFKVFNIANKTNPQQVRNLKFEGNLTNSRMIGDYVYFITSNYQHYIESEPLLPRVIGDDNTVINKCSNNEKCFNPGVYYFDIPYSSYNFTSVYAINIVDDSVGLTGDVYIMDGNQNMYVSQDNIFITYTKYISEYQLEAEVLREMVYSRLGKREQEKIAKIEAVDSFILNKQEKIRKITGIIERYKTSLLDEERNALEKELEIAMKKKYIDISKELEKTVIHKIAIDKGVLKYQTSGEVVGHVLNQFSMDENKDFFRIATTKNRTWSRYMDEEDLQSYNNLYVLDENLKLVGSLDYLANGEKIYSVRFMQDRAYMVTFRQVDPLFVIDLSNPKNPQVLGKLKIPGFSNYLHPYDEKILIGIGKDTYENKWGGVGTAGIKLSMFDVADVGNPREIDTYVLGDTGSESIALYDHKAFLFSKEKHLLAMPVVLRKAKNARGWGQLDFNGTVVFDVDENGFKLKGKINHNNIEQENNNLHMDSYSYNYSNNIKRNLYIDDVLYTLSDNYIKMNKLTDLDEINTLRLIKEKSSQDDFNVVN